MKYSQIPRLAVITAALCLTSTVFAQSTEASDPEIEAVLKKYEAEFKKLESRAKDLEANAPDGAENTVGLDWDGKMKRHEINFGVPEFRMKLKRVVFDVPEVSMELKRIVWGNPETTMELRTVGKYPEFHGLKVKWSDIKTHVPVVRLVQREAKLHLPRVTMKRVEWKLDLPEVFRTRQVRWVFDLPEIKVRTTDQAKREIEDEAGKMKATSETLARAQQSEIKTIAVRRMSATRDQLKEQFDRAVSQITDAIQNAKANGIDPANLIGDDGVKTNLLEVLNDVNAKFGGTLRELNEKIQEMSA